MKKKATKKAGPKLCVKCRAPIRAPQLGQSSRSIQGELCARCAPVPGRMRLVLTVDVTKLSDQQVDDLESALLRSCSYTLRLYGVLR